MKKQNRRIFIITVAVLIMMLVVAAGTAASVYAFRQLTASDNSSQSESAVIQQAESDSENLWEKGVLVAGVAPDSPAAQAGLRRGAIILEIDGTEVNTPLELKSAISEKEAGDSISLTVLLCDSPEVIDVTLGSAGPYLGLDVFGGAPFLFEGNDGFMPEFPDEFHFDHGFKFGPGFPEHFEGMEEFFKDLPEEFEGLPHFFEEMPDEFDFSFSAMVIDVATGSPAESAGLEEGDLIVAINGEEMGDQEEIVEAISSFEPGQEISISIDRNGEPLELAVVLGEHPEDGQQAYLGVFLGAGAFHRDFRFGEPDEQNS